MSKAPRPDDDKNRLSSDGQNLQSAAWGLTLVLPLWLTYVSNQWSRFSFTYLVDFGPTAEAFKALNVDLAIDQSQYALLASVAFTTLFAVASLGAGAAADRLDRKTLTVAAAAAWSAATYGESVSTSFGQLVACRVLMGLACAFSTPTAYTLIGDFVPPSRQALASSLYGTGVALASGLSSLVILLDDAVGWRSALLVVAAFGLVAAGAGAVLLPRDDRQQPEATTAATGTAGGDVAGSSFTADVTSVVSVRRVQWLFLAAFLRFCSGLCIGVWGAPFFRLTYPDSQAAYSVVQAAISAVGASLSGLLGGAAADALLERAAAGGAEGGSTPDPQGRRLLVPVIGSLLAAPAWYLAVQTGQSFESAMAWLAVEYFVAECWFGPTISFLQASVPKGTGGTAQGMFTLTGALANFAPSILGYYYSQSSGVGDAVASSSQLSGLLAGVVCAGYVSSAICFALAARSAPATPEKGKSE